MDPEQVYKCEPVTIENVIPLQERDPELKEYILRACNQILRVIMAQSSFLRPNRQLLYLLSPWAFQSSEVQDANAPEFARMKSALAALQFEGERLTADLNRILTRDTQLRECCRNHNLLLARFFDQYIVPDMVIALMSDDRAQAERAWERFENLVYGQGPLRKTAYTHIFNFCAAAQSLKVGDVRIERLDPNTLDAIIGEVAARPLLHHAKGGDFFIVAEEQGPFTDDDNWLERKHREALQFCQFLQYQRDGVVHGTYTVPFYLPYWVNSVRKFGVEFIGAPRLSPYREGRATYAVGDSDLNSMRRWWNCFKSAKVQARLSDERNGFRQTLLRAGEYYEASLRKESSPERLVDLAIALESMFTLASAKTDLTFRIAQGAAQLVGDTVEERLAIAKSMRRLTTSCE